MLNYPLSPLKNIKESTHSLEVLTEQVSAHHFIVSPVRDDNKILVLLLKGPIVRTREIKFADQEKGREKMTESRIVVGLGNVLMAT